MPCVLSPDDTTDGEFPRLADVQAAICDAAGALGVAEWTLQGVHAWPVLRAVVYGVLNQVQKRAYGRIPPPPTAEGQVPPSVGRSRCAAPRLTLLSGAALFDGRAQQAAPMVLLHQRPADYVAPDRIMDPLTVALTAADVSTCRLYHLEPTAEVANDAIAYRLGITDTAEHLEDREVRDFLARAQQLLAWLDARGLDSGETPLGLFCRMVEILNRARGAAVVLSYLTPRLVVVHRYHDPDQIPLVIAARQLGVPCVDIQHGYADSCTPSNDFHEAPPDGYIGLPDVFWTWSAATARRLDASFPVRRQRPCVMVGGAPWYWDVLPPATGHAAPHGPPTVLVAHQPDMILDAPAGEVLPAAMLEAMAVGGDSLRWLIRLHPTSRALAPLVGASLSLRGLGGCADVDVATGAPWPDLARQVDVVVTGYSALALEARAFGLPVVILGHGSARVLEPVMAEAGLQLADDAGSLLAAIADALRTPAFSWSYIDPVPAAVAVSCLMRLAGDGTARVCR